LIQEVHQQRDVFLQAETLPHLDQMIASDGPKLWIVPEQIGELGPLVDKVRPCEAGNLLLEARRTDQFRQYRTRVIEAQRLIEIGREQVVRGGRL
jgi:hypothetical protein